MQWVAVGDGTVGIQERGPDFSFTLEIITGGTPRVLNCLEPEYWEAYPHTPAREFAQFVKLVKGRQSFMGPVLTVLGSEISPECQAALAVQQRLDLERSVRYYQEVLGIGGRAH